MPRSFSRSFESMMRSTLSRLRSVPDCCSSLSISVVLPWSTCAMMAMFRSFVVISQVKVNIASHIDVDYIRLNAQVPSDLGESTRRHRGRRRYADELRCNDKFRLVPISMTIGQKIIPDGAHQPWRRGFYHFHERLTDLPQVEVRPAMIIAPLQLAPISHRVAK